MIKSLPTSHDPHQSARELSSFLLLVLLILVCSGCGSSPFKEFNQAVIVSDPESIAAEKHLTKSLKQNPKDAETWNQLGIISFEKKEWRLAEDCFRKAFSLDRLNPAYPRNLAMLYAETKNFSLAEKFTERALQLDPGNTETRIVQAKIALLQDKYPESEAILSSILAADPSNKEAQTLLARLRKTPR